MQPIKSLSVSDGRRLASARLLPNFSTFVVHSIAFDEAYLDTALSRSCVGKVLFGRSSPRHATAVFARAPPISLPAFRAAGTEPARYLVQDLTATLAEHTSSRNETDTTRYRDSDPPVPVVHVRCFLLPFGFALYDNTDRTLITRKNRTIPSEEK